MSVNIIKEPSGKLNIISDFTEPITLTTSGQEAIVTVNNVSALMSLDTLTTVYSGENNTRQLRMYFRISISSNPTQWSEWEEIDPNGESKCFPDVTPFYDYNIQLKFVRIGGSDTGEININSFDWEGVWNSNKIDEPIIDLPSNSEVVIFDSPDTLKVFRLDGYELVARGTGDLELKYRISQNNKRSWSPWTPLTNDNLKTEVIDPIRFFNIQYSLQNNGTGVIQIRDLNIYGSFINVTKNYTTANLFGLRENCKNGVVGNTGLGSNDLNMSSNMETEPSVWSSMSCEEGDLYNPYKLDEAIGLYDKLANDATAVGGWTVQYFRTDPDGNGIDHTLHEYSLKNIVEYKDVKIMVPDNQFPNGQMAFNQYDLYTIDSFEVHLTKQEFKKVFGAEFRPRVKDFFWFCDISKVYEVESSQALRGFGNAEVYYKIILKKYNQDASRRASTSDIADAIDNIVKNSTLEDLFGTRMRQDKDEVALKKQHDTLTKDRIRGKILASVEKGLIENAELILSKYHYNLSTITAGDDAVIYQNADLYLQAGKNRAFIAWFKLKDYADNDVYNLINNYNPDLNKGYKFDIDNGLLTSTINTDTYTMDVSDYLFDDVWYCVLINIDQRQQYISHYLYKRNVNREIDAGSLNSTKLKLLVSETLDYNVNEFELDLDMVTLKITASNMLITNLRIFDDVIPLEQHTKILNQQIVRDTDHIILADNANKLMVLPKYPLG